MKEETTIMEKDFQLPLLKISGNQRYVVQENGVPFFWLGDTAWELFHRINLQDSIFYLHNRAKKGFTVVMAVLLAELDGLNTPNANGDPPLHNNDPAKPNESYFRHVDAVVREAEKSGIYMALLPTWGDKYQKAWGIGPEIFTEDNAGTYGEFLGDRYKDYNNIIWVLGGDRTPKNASDFAINNALAKGIRNLDKRHLMTYHPNGGNIASSWFGKEDWLDLDMFQSRHQKGFLEFKYTLKARKQQPVRPVINGEPGYENIPNLLNKFNLKRLDAADVRRSAYWSMFAGAAGHTYGCNEVWQMYSKDKVALFGACLDWKEALELQGATQMGFLRRILEYFDWQEMVMDQKLIDNFNWKGSGYLIALRNVDKDLILVYNPRGKTIRIRLSQINIKEIEAFWYDPRTGKTEYIGNYKTDNTAPFQPTGKDRDWVLILLPKRLSFMLER